MLRFYHCILLIFFIWAVQGSIIRGSLKTSTTVDASNNVIKRSYCEFLKEQHNINDKWDLDFPNCYNCQCTSAGLLCRGFGIRAGVIVPPPGKKLKPDQCKIEYIDA